MQFILPFLWGIPLFYSTAIFGWMSSGDIWYSKRFEEILDTAFKNSTRYCGGAKAAWVSFWEGGVVVDRLQFPEMGASNNLRMNYVIRMSTLHLPYRFQPKWHLSILKKKNLTHNDLSNAISKECTPRGQTQFSSDHIGPTSQQHHQSAAYYLYKLLSTDSKFNLKPQA